MVQLLQEGTKANTPYKQYVCDNASDIAEIPTQLGSIALCLENKTFYVCGSDGSWTEFALE